MSTPPEPHETNNSYDANEANGANATNDAARQYRRILTLLPRTYREQHGPEMLTTLLDAAADTCRTRPSPGDWLSVLGLSLRLRAGAPGASPKARSAGETLRLIALLGLLLQTGTPRQLQTLTTEPGIGSLLRHASITTWGNAAIVICGVLGPCLAIAALLRGRHRLGRVLLTANAVLFLATFPQVFVVGSDTWWENGCALLVLCIVPLLAGLLGFHRDAPRVQQPQWWLAAAAFTAFALLLSVYAIAPFDGRPSYVLFKDLQLPSCLFEAGCACLLAVMAVRHARRSAAGPLALMLAASPLLLVLPSTITAVYVSTQTALLRPVSITAVVGPAFRPYTWISLYVLAAEVLLAITLVATPRQLKTTLSAS